MVFETNWELISTLILKGLEQGSRYLSLIKTNILKLSSKAVSNFQTQPFLWGASLQLYTPTTTVFYSTLSTFESPLPLPPGFNKMALFYF